MKVKVQCKVCDSKFYICSIAKYRNVKGIKKALKNRKGFFCCSNCSDRIDDILKS
ncbi:MAG: hypothetical protein ACRDD7_13710 [Peptostreptococcaceae bacterium]